MWSSNLWRGEGKHIIILGRKDRHRYIDALTYVQELTKDKSLKVPLPQSAIDVGQSSVKAKEGRGTGKSE